MQGTLYVSLGSIVGANLAFLLGRYLARDWVRGRVETSPRFRAIDDAVGREGWKIVGLTRLARRALRQRVEEDQEEGGGEPDTVERERG